MGNLQKMVFFHTQKVLFYTWNFLFSYPRVWNGKFAKLVFFHTRKVLFHTWNFYFHTFKFLFSYLKNFFHTPIQKFHTLWKLFLFHVVLSFHTKHKHFVAWAWYFIPSVQVFIPHATNFKQGGLCAATSPQRESLRLEVVNHTSRPPHTLVVLSQSISYLIYSFSYQIGMKKLHKVWKMILKNKLI
jgi:hypothetical protein